MAEKIMLPGIDHSWTPCTLEILSIYQVVHHCIKFKSFPKFKTITYRQFYTRQELGSATIKFILGLSLTLLLVIIIGSAY